MNKIYINKLMDEVDKIELHSIVQIERDGDVGKYKVEFDEEFDDIELISLDETNTIWGSCGDNIEELKLELLREGIRGSFKDILVLA